MAINDISLTSGMRSNLLSLQNTVSLLDRTQTRLSTGKKVNTAIDNPVSYFASQSLTSRASVIDSLKDAMGQAVSTINAADKGITAISSMIEQAKGIAQQAQSAESTPAASVTLTLSSVLNAATVVIGGVTLTATTGAATGDQFDVNGTDAEDATALADLINSQVTLAAAGYTASANGAVVTLSYAPSGVGSDIDSSDVTSGAGITEADVANTSELKSLQDQYNTLLDQLTALAEDSGYKGKNLLSATDTLRSLNVKFEGTTLTVDGFDATASGLGISDASWINQGTGTASTIDSDIDLLDAAATTLRKESSKMSGNLSIITVRQDFSTNMINTLTEGSDKLTLADSNEEGANMLMLQTRQSLSTTALSLSAQAAQSVLQLFG